ncbi:MAG TPA: chromosome partitioning protein ParB [Cyanobacteria bacterium UBA12227]|nr:chromosome partitioning protein ParB [Cyanobacteria bacterium UBA12227]HAX84748.1 chromosome partitioning protein ParB [Cyanobacteria bacterium UBA11370]HBY81551.1 chromosome partitioning protein ParB [Cyanobacteria bacterium UBA11148]
MSEPKNSKKQKPYAGKIDISGLFDLADENEPTADNSSAPKPLIPVEQIHRKPEQVRRYFDPQKMEQLTRSVKAHGILENLIVRPLPGKDGEYELVAGERRYRAALAAGLSEVPVLILDLTDSEARQIALVENLQREDLNPVEETEGVLQLLSIRLNLAVPEVISLLYRMQNAQTRNVNHNVMAQPDEVEVEKLFTTLGRMSWQSFVKHRLPLLNLPEEILESLRQGEIAYTKATAIARMKEETIRQELLREAIEKDLSLSQIRERIKAVTTPAKEEPPSLKNRVKETHGRLQKAKFWDNPEKQEQLEKLLAQMESLLADE